MRFIVFGCSHTYGEGITEHDLPRFGSTPSNHSWPMYLKRYYKIPIVNYSYPGSSNHYILNAIRKHKWQKNDIAVILFTYHTRYSYYSNEQTCENILPGAVSRINNKEENRINKSFYKTFNNYHIEKINLIDVEHVYLFLKYNNIPYVNKFCRQFTRLIANEVNDEILNDSTFTIQNHANSLFTEKELTGYDGAHYSKDVHKTWAKHLRKFINPIVDRLQLPGSTQ